MKLHANHLKNLQSDHLCPPLHRRLFAFHDIVTQMALFGSLGTSTTPFVWNVSSDDQMALLLFLTSGCGAGPRKTRSKSTREAFRAASKTRPLTHTRTPETHSYSSHWEEQLHLWPEWLTYLKIHFKKRLFQGNSRTFSISTDKNQEGARWPLTPQV